jgi:hypothetical protein
MVLNDFPSLVRRGIQKTTTAKKGQKANRPMSKRIPPTEAEKQEFLAIRGDATNLDRTLAEAHKAKLAAYARCNGETLRCVKKQRDAEAKLPNDQQRRENVCLGLERVVKKLRRESDPRADRVDQFRTAAVEELHSYITLTEQFAAPAADPVGDAARAAARELQKTLPKCFASDADAMQFALALPMIEARAAAVREADKRQAVDTERLRIGRDFWELIGRACRAAGLGNDDAAIKRLSDMALA